MNPGKACIAITRRKAFSNALRNFSLLVDEHKIGSLKTGQQARFELPAGTHQVQVKLDFYKSPVLDIHLHDNETLYLECGDKGPDTLIKGLTFEGLGRAMSSMVSPGDYLYIRQAEMPDTRDTPLPPRPEPRPAPRPSPAPAEDFGIFVSYRRDDSHAVTGRLCDRLNEHFGRTAVFRDVDSIPVGMDFRVKIRETIKGSRAQLVVIGPDWLEASDQHGDKRLWRENDFVRFEIEAALKQEIPVIPLLVDGAVMPGPEQLPESIAQLAYQNALPIPQEPYFHAGVDRLIDSLEKLRAGKPGGGGANQPQFCTACGNTLQPGQKFCTVCGQPV